MHCVICLLCLAFTLVAGNARDQSPEQLPPRVVLSETAMATCYEANSNRVAGSMLVRRPILLSPDGHHQAYAENIAVAHGHLGQCANSAKLFVRRPGDQEFRVAYHQAPREYDLFNDITIVDWSPDSHYLLAELAIGQWGSDFGGLTPLLYDAQSGAVTPEKWLDGAFNSYFGHTCSYIVGSLGFARSGSVVLKVRPTVDEEGVGDPESCVKKERLVLLNPATRAITLLAGKHKVQRYGRILKGQSGR
jgi:hypothetical protein